MKRILFLWLTLFATISLWAAFTPSTFTVAAKGKQVVFSQGNLQCTLSATDTTWSFAEYQTEMLGGDNISGSSLADKIDLFGWSGSTGTAKWGISTSYEVSDYAGDFVDWGTNIGDGTTYRTLTRGEWYYLLNTRTNAGEKKGVARIQISDTEYANGLILLPDSWTCPAGITFKSGFASNYGIDYYATYQTFTLTEWQKLESAGAVFLPASGDRDGSSMRFVQIYSGYWSATAYDSFYSYYLCFYANGAFTYDGNSRCMGRPVRLVQDIKYAISITQPEHGTIAADKEACAEGRTVTLTLSPDAYYAPKTITVLQGETAIATTAVEGTTYQYTFTMPIGEVTITAEFEKVSSAFTPSAFTVSESGKQVLFSQGNLQCTLSATDTTWSFADYQTEMLGTDNVTGGTESYDATYGYSKSGSALADKIDLFGWSGSTGTAQWGISTTTSSSDYAGNFADWGTNTIGTNAPNTYRTLTRDEWDYLLNTRANASNLIGVAHIQLSDTEYANGLILLPDSWTCPAGVTFTSGFSSSGSVQAYADYQTFTLAQWQQLESEGAVFLPASGCRYGSSVGGVRCYGNYWSATALGSNAYGRYFYSHEVFEDYYGHIRGQAVRLVQDIKYAISITQPEHGTIAADKEACAEGRTVTLTLSPDAYYAPKTITVLQGETAIATTAVEGTTYQYTFTMPIGEVTITAEFEKVSSAFTPSAFTVSESGKQVLFSQGNLQCTLSATDTTWSFAEYQTEMIGTANISSGTLANKIDLFGWSGSTGTAQWGISTSTSYSDYSGDFMDWGMNIGDGTTYRTLTNDEWTYLLNTRTNANEKQGVARIKLNDTEYANGLILLPDSWTCPEGVIFKSGLASEWSIEAYATYQTFTLVEWQKLEAAGAVFLPASGGRDGLRMYNVQRNGVYWSATAYDSLNAYNLSFGSDGVYLGGNGRVYGQAVRLVQDIYAVTLTTPEHGSIAANKTEAIAGETITLTITPDTGYELDVLTVKDAANNDIAVTNNTFTMPASDVTVTATFKQTIPTAVGNTTDTAETTIRKILRNGQVLILRNGKTYTTTGLEMK